MRGKIQRSLLAGIVLLAASGSASATLIGDNVGWFVNALGGIEFATSSPGTFSIGGTQLNTGAALAGFCIRADGSSQNCSSSGISGTVAVLADSIVIRMFGSTGSSGTIEWGFYDLDWVGASGEIVDVIAPSDPRGISIDSFGADFVNLSTTNTNFVGSPNEFVFELVTRHVSEPASLALMALGIIGVGARRRRVRA